VFSESEDTPAPNPNIISLHHNIAESDDDASSPANVSLAVNSSVNTVVQPGPFPVAESAVGNASESVVADESQTQLPLRPLSLPLPDSHTVSTVSRAPSEDHPRDASPECREIPSFYMALLPSEPGGSCHHRQPEEGASLSMGLDLHVPPLDASPISFGLRSQSPRLRGLQPPPRTTPVRGVGNRKRATRSAGAPAASKAPKVEGEYGPSVPKTPARRRRNRRGRKYKGPRGIQVTIQTSRADERLVESDPVPIAPN
jgi:hypothetical protein